MNRTNASQQLIWGAHAPRVPFAAPPPQTSLPRPQNAFDEAPNTARETRVLPED